VTKFNVDVLYSVSLTSVW